jgi:hypothetical protein
MVTARMFVLLLLSWVQCFVTAVNLLSFTESSSWPSARKTTKHVWFLNRGAPFWFFSSLSGGIIWWTLFLSSVSTLNRFLLVESSCRLDMTLKDWVILRKEWLIQLITLLVSLWGHIVSDRDSLSVVLASQDRLDTLQLFHLPRVSQHLHFILKTSRNTVLTSSHWSLVKSFRYRRLPINPSSGHGHLSW